MDKGSPVSLLLAGEPGELLEKLRSLLQQASFPAAAVASGKEAETLLAKKTWAVLLLLPPFTAEQALSLRREAPGTAVLLLLSPEAYGAHAPALAEEGVLVLPADAENPLLYQGLLLLKGLSLRLRALQSRAETLEEKMTEIRLVNRAKLLLVEKLRMSEADAHRYIEKTAMDRSLKKRDVALSVIRTYES